MKQINFYHRKHLLTGMMLLFFTLGSLLAQESATATEIDKKVEAFLNENRRQWRDMNVPSSDGKLLYDLILKNKYTKGLEIGTSTGHSTIWIAWAFSKTGGKLITIEIDERRHKEALSNLEKAGLSDFVEARLADAHQLVKELKGPFDFVFSDADKGWYTNYFKDVDPKLLSGGCFTAHNIRADGRRAMAGTKEFLEYVQALDNYKTTVDSSGGGLSISYKN
ncbi:MAG: O-methyltransferase [Flavobacteriaceae bacterium]